MSRVSRLDCTKPVRSCSISVCTTSTLLEISSMEFLSALTWPRSSVSSVSIWLIPWSSLKIISITSWVWLMQPVELEPGSRLGVFCWRPALSRDLLLIPRVFLQLLTSESDETHSWLFFHFLSFRSAPSRSVCKLERSTRSPSELPSEGARLIRLFLFLLTGMVKAFCSSNLWTSLASLRESE